MGVGIEDDTRIIACHLDERSSKTVCTLSKTLRDRGSSVSIVGAGTYLFCQRKSNRINYSASVFNFFL